MSEIELLTPEQVARRLQVKTRTVQEWLRSGRLVGVKLGKMWRVRRGDLETFLNGSTVHAGANQQSRVTERSTVEAPAESALGSAAEPPEAAAEEVDEEHVGKRLLAMIDRIVAQVPEEEWDKVSTDLAEQHDHYIYGLPKRKS